MEVNRNNQQIGKQINKDKRQMKDNDSNGKSIIEFTQEEFVKLPADRKKVVYGIDRARDAAYYYRRAYCAIVTAAHDVLCTDPIGFALYDKIMARTKKEREEADKKEAEERNTLNLSERIAAIKSWKREVRARFAAEKGGEK